MARDWTKAERDFLSMNYTAYKAAGATRLFNKRFPKRSQKDIIRTASKMGLTNEVHPGFYSLPELSLLSKTSTWNLIYHIKKGNIKAKKHGYHWFVSDKEAEMVIQKFNPRKIWDEINTREASRRIGYMDEGALTQRVTRDGAIPSVRRGLFVYIPVAYIEAAERQMMTTGNIRVNWKKIHEELGYESRK